MSDETKTKLEGDDEITLDMHNVYAKQAPTVTSPTDAVRWADANWSDLRRGMRAVLGWVRANLVAPAVADARKREREDARAAVDRMRKDRDKLRAWADEWNSKACELQHQLNLANDSLAAEKSRSENLAKGLREANRLGTDYVGEIRELRAKVAELEAHTCKGSGEEWREVLFPNVAWNDMASWAQMVCNLAAEQMAVPKFVLESCRMRSWAHMSRRLRDRIRATFTKLRAEHGEMLIQTASEEYHRGLAAKLVIPTPAALPKVGEIEIANLRNGAKIDAGLPDWVTGKVYNDDYPESFAAAPQGYAGTNTYYYADEGKTWRRVQPQPATIEPPSEDVATPELDKVEGHEPLTRLWSGIVDSQLRPLPVGTMMVKENGPWLHRNYVKAAYRRDLAAAITRETELLRKENEELRGEASGTLEALKLADEDLAKIFAVVEPVAKKGEKWIAAAVRLLKENEELRAELETARQVIALSQDDAKSWERVAAKMMMERDDLRRQLREHAGECAVCGRSLSGTGSYLRPDPVTRQNVRVCDECGGEKSPLEVDAAIVERRAGKCAVCGETLHDRSSFPWKGVRVCGDCAQQSQSKLEAAIDARRAGK